MRDGIVVGVGPGLAKVEARVQGRRASMAVLITGGRTDSVAVPAGSVLTLDPSAVALLPGESVQLSASAILQDGSPVAPGRVTWKTLAASVATVDSAGVVLGVGPGRTIVQATASGLMATAPVTVEPSRLHPHSVTGGAEPRSGRHPARGDTLPGQSRDPKRGAMVLERHGCGSGRTVGDRHRAAVPVMPAWSRRATPSRTAPK